VTGRNGFRKKKEESRRERLSIYKLGNPTIGGARAEEFKSLQAKNNNGEG